MQAQISLIPAVSKALIGRAVVALPEMKRARQAGTIMISTGTTTAHIYAELRKEAEIPAAACGMITPKGACLGASMTGFMKEKAHARFWVFKDGKAVEAEDLEQTIAALKARDVFIKGANALDSSGQAGIFMGAPAGGTLGRALGQIMRQGIFFIIPVGLEKLIFGSVIEAAGKMGVERIDRSMGMPVGLMPVFGKVMTELQALQVLTGVEACQVGAGGVAGAEGAVTLLLEGSPAQIGKALKLIEGLKEACSRRVSPIQPSACRTHRWPTCLTKNYCFGENAKKNR
jgi:hypothetical protein